MIDVELLIKKRGRLWIYRMHILLLLQGTEVKSNL